MTDWNAAHIELRSTGVAGDDPVRVVVNGDLPRYGTQSFLDLKQPDRLCVTDRDIEQDGENFLLEETGVELKCHENRCDQASPTNALLEMIRENLERDCRHDAPPI